MKSVMKFYKDINLSKYTGAARKYLFRKDFVASDNKKTIDIATRDAWKDNWRGHSVEEAMSIFGYTRVKRLVGRFKEVLPSGGKLLEGGCGLGPWLIQFKRLGYDVKGVDYDPVSVGKIKEYDASIDVTEADITDMPFDDDSFDIYTSFGVLEHFSEGPEKAIKEAARVLKPGGIFLVTLPYLNILLRMKLPVMKLKKNNFLRTIFGKDKKAYYYEKYFSRNEIRGILADNGFVVKMCDPVDHIFSFVQFSDIFRNNNSYDGENDLAVKCADFFEKILPWQTAGSMLLVCENAGGKGGS